MNGSTTAKDYLEKILDELEKLNKEITRLKIETVKLSVRIESYEGEAVGIKLIEDRFLRRRPLNLEEVLDLVHETREAVRTIEYDFNAIRGSMDNIARDGISRDEMKPWLKE